MDPLQANINGFVFLNLTCFSEQDHAHKEEEEGCYSYYSTHDAAELMIYAYVDTHPTVADLLWTKQQMKQGEFLRLTAPPRVFSNAVMEDEYSVTDTSLSTHQPLLLSDSTAL